MSTHTPGPWVCDGRWIKAACGSGWWYLAEVCEHVDLGEGDLVRANGQVLAAAPDLLAAAHETVSALTDQFSLMGADDDYIYDELGSGLSAAFFSARAAIAKATGAQP